MGKDDEKLSRLRTLIDGLSERDRRLVELKLGVDLASKDAPKLLVEHYDETLVRIHEIEQQALSKIRARREESDED
jgi:DNA-directed RNA polymerase sigma subunit (sigma70/sigma32)